MSRIFRPLEIATCAVLCFCIGLASPWLYTSVGYWLVTVPMCFMVGMLVPMLNRSSEQLPRHVDEAEHDRSDHDRDHG